MSGPSASSATLPRTAPASASRVAWLSRHRQSVIVWLLLIGAPLWMPLVGSYIQLGSQILVFALTAMALNILLGYTGVISFGEAAYFGLGAYGSGLFLKYVMPSTLLAVLAGVLLGGIAACLVGPLIMRRRGVYFAMTTIAFSQLFYFVAERWNGLTGGEDGLTGFQRQPIDFGFARITLEGAGFYYFALFFFALTAGVIAAILRSPLGHTWMAIRENVRRARYLGLRTDWYVWAAFAVAGTLAALGGSMEALLNNFASPQDLFFIVSGNFVIMVVLGGMGTFWGPLVGAAIFITAQDYLSSLTANWQSFVGVLFVVVVLAFPRGILGLRRGRKRA
ncbi:MAG TPA: branched-chain amino acid ABC transporter permease [Acetobacteraceae bacterium]|nr:branched-chain amino acid ABC transporter permease [Acetobacteraceae bacterium]